MRKRLSAIGICFIILSALATAEVRVSAEETNQSGGSAEELTQSQKELELLKQQIADKNAEMQRIEEEIARYKIQIEQTGKEASTLSGVIKKLEATKAKLSGDIKLTGKKIETTNLNISRLGIAIDDKKGKILQGMRALEIAIRKTDELDLRSPVEVVLANENLYDGWNDVIALEKFQGGVNEQLSVLKSLKRELESSKMETEAEKQTGEDEIESYYFFTIDYLPNKFDYRWLSVEKYWDIRWHRGNDEG
mgnify:CR=1 FL=1